MKRILWLMPMAIGLAMLAGSLMHLGTAPQEAQAAPPLSLEGFLDEVVPEAKEEEQLLVDNSSCYVCHGNYDGEPLVMKHGMQEVGCIDCHGQSYDHRNDENHEIPPDKMYDVGDIDKMCNGCHDEMHDAPAAKVIARWQKKCPKKTDPKTIVCTDCHFQHRLAFRTVWWNKKTGEMIIRKEGQRTKQAEDLTEKADEE